MRTIEEITASGKVIINEKNHDGFKGHIYIRGWDGTLVVSWGCGWDHVSVAPRKRNYIPTWDDMCAIKDIFFRDDEPAIQIHPPKDEYINNLSNCLHLWRDNEFDMILPPSWMVGLKEGQTYSDVLQEVNKYKKENGY